MPEGFTRIVQVGWGHLDANGHMANTAYLDLCVDVRMMFFREHGVTMMTFQGLRVGPVVRRDELEYFRELHLLEPVRITLELAGLSEDGSRFALRHEFFKEDGRLAARVATLGGWMDLAARKLIAAPAPIAAALAAMPRADDFSALDSSVR